MFSYAPWRRDFDIEVLKSVCFLIAGCARMRRLAEADTVSTQKAFGVFVLITLQPALQ